MRCNRPDRCKFWSERIARYSPTEGDREVKALCLCDVSPHHQQYTYATDGCDFGEAGEPVDLRW
jgi:hypothetical protein